jgi:hypothetical protein
LEKQGWKSRSMPKLSECVGLNKRYNKILYEKKGVKKRRKNAIKIKIYNLGKRGK